jgi:hypothetical protein
VVITTDEQPWALEQRGVLSPKESHTVAPKKAKKIVEAEVSKGICHSDFAEPETFQRIQQGRLVQIPLPDAPAE